MSDIMQRIKRIATIPPEYLVKCPPPPKSVKIELTTKCNYKCAYCAYSHRPEEKKMDMDWELFKRITSEMKSIGVEEIGVFYIGESFTNPQYLVKAIKYLKSELEIPYVFLTSNGSLARPEVVKECMAAGLNSLKWSCNFANAEQFSKIAGVSPKMFEMMKENIKGAWEVRNGFTTSLAASSIAYDANQEELMRPFLQESVLPYVDKHYWLPLFTMGGVAKESEQELGYQPVAGNPSNLEDPVAPIPCWTIFTAGHVLADGRMTACCMDGTGNWEVGDLTKQTFMEAWHSEKFQELREAHIKKNILGTKCEKCALVGE